MRLSWLLLVGALASSSAARAAQMGEIVVDSALVYEQPSSDSTTLIELPKGTGVRISNEQRDGWYKVSVPGHLPPLVGWIQGNAVDPKAIAKDLTAGGIQKAENTSSESNRHHFVLDVLGSGDYLLKMATVQAAAGTAAGNPLVYGFCADLGYRLSTTWTLKARFAPLPLAEGTGTAAYSITGTRLGLMIDYAFLHSLPFKLTFGVGGGEIFSIAGSIGANSITPTSMFWFPAELAFNWYPFENLALVVAAGFQYTIQAPLTVAGGGSVEADFMAAYAHAGLRVEF
ncbi:MAG TPA: SH3 domain-containing protein [Bdellovibrionota bacterium]|nr:SH3 domain-containing protein [Bdellovibrionota bacterium]